MRLSRLIRDIGRTGANALRARLDPRTVPVPPQRLVDRIGSGDYRAVGLELFRLVREHGGLQSSDRVLDIGCGVGRLAAPLTRYLEGEGRYDGFDIDREMVEWCQRNISPAHPRFAFRHVDAFSSHYNPNGSISSTALPFPYEDRAFTFVAATSVFTHLVSADAEHYLQQVRRVLAPGGTLIATFFLLNDESRTLMARGEATFVFSPPPPGRSTTEPHHILREDDPEHAVAYPADWIMRLLEENDLASSLIVHPGGWCGRRDTLTFQDVVVTHRTA